MYNTPREVRGDQFAEESREGVAVVVGVGQAEPARAHEAQGGRGRPPKHQGVGAPEERVFLPNKQNPQNKDPQQII